MAGYISIEAPSGSGYHAVIERDSDGQYALLGSHTWEAFSAAHWASYALDLPELSGSPGIYRAAFPSWIAAGVYTVRIRSGAAASATASASPIDNEVWQWDGTGRAVAADVAADVWTYAMRTLTVSAALVQAAVSGSTITCLRGDTLSASLTDVGSLAGRTKLWFTAKRTPGEADSEALIQIEETAGLVRLSGAAATAGQGSITVSDASAGDVTLALAAVATAGLAPGTYGYDLQMLSAAGVITRAFGVFIVTAAADLTRATS